MDDLNRRAEEIFHEAADLDQAARAEHVTRICGGDTALLAKVKSLLGDLDEMGDGFLAQPAFKSGPVVVDPSLPLPGQQFGGYRILRLIGQGGMGSVFEAEQANPRRTVALKVMRSAVATQSMLRRFEQEAWVLGQLHHPGIAQVYEAGAVPSPYGQLPFFAMELIRGRPLLAYVEQVGRDVRHCLELMAMICDAVQHAHDHGVIHRDLKPANILIVSGKTLADAPLDHRPQTLNPITKILDFGIARITHSDMQSLSMHTTAGQIVGTIPYMSPEQVGADASRIDARSDVYSLGVILFEVLAGRLPYDLAERPIPEAARVIRDEEPSHLSSINRLFRGDIETIVSKALEKDPARRYASAAALAADIRRYLNDEPIVARPASTFYQFRKFARRNSRFVSAVFAAFVILVLGAVFSFRFGIMASRQRDRADREARESLQQAYQANIAAAAAALESNDVATARRHLEQAPAALRGWEWRHFVSRLDESLLMVKTIDKNYGGASFDESSNRLILPWTSVETGHALTCRLMRWNAQTGQSEDDGSAWEAWRSLWLAPGGRDTWNRYLLLDGSAQTPLPDGRLIPVPWTSQLGPAKQLFGATLSPDGRLIAFYLGQPKYTLCIGRLDDLNAPLIKRDLKDGNVVFQFSPDGKILLTADIVSHASLWDTHSGREIATLSGHTDRVMAARFSPDGAKIATAAWDQTVRVWDVVTAACLQVGRGHSDLVDAVDWQRQGELIVSGGRDSTVRLWAADSLAPVAVLRGHENAVVSVVFSRDGGRIVSRDLGGEMRVWDASRRGDAGVLRGHTSYVYPVAISADGAMIASGGWDNVIRLWSAQTGAPLGVLEGHTSPLQRVAFSPDGARLVSSAADRTVRVWDVRQRTLMATRQGWSEAPLAFDDDNTRVVVDWKPPESITLWSPATGGVETQPFAAMGRVRSGLLSADRRFVMALVAREGKPFREVIELSSGQPRIIEETPRGTVPLACALSPDGSRWVCELPDHGIGVWDVRSGQRVAAMQGHRGEVFAVAFSPDGKRIASAGRDRVIRLWDAVTHKEIAQLRGHNAYAWSLVFSPDGTQIISGSGDHTVRIWDTKPLRERLRAAPGS